MKANKIQILIIKMKCNRFLIFGMIVLFIIFFTSGCTQLDVTQAPETVRYCEKDDDCKSLSGNSAGCWNVNFVPPPLAPWELTISLAGPDKCVCYENICASLKAAARRESLYSISKAFDICDKYERKSDIFNCYEMVICREITNKNKDLCYQKISDICPEITEYEHVKDSCYKKVAILKGDVSWCFKFSAEEQYRCVAEVGILAKDASMCQMISSNIAKDECLSKVAVSIENTAICSQISDYNPIIESECLYGIALSAENLPVCEKIKLSYYREKCFEEVISPDKELAHCTNLEPIQQARCYGTVAFLENDLDICEKLPFVEPHYKRDCISEFIEHLVENNEDISICNSIKDNDVKNICYKSFFTERGNTDTCNKFTGELKRSCFYGLYLY